MPIPPDVLALVVKAASKHGFLKCHDCAKELSALFASKGIHGVVLRLTTKGGRGYIVMTDPNFKLPFQSPAGVDCISNNGKHYGVSVGDQVFDNVFRSGIDLKDWRNSFECDVHDFDTKAIDPF
jgi:hypothetical protein